MGQFNFTLNNAFLFKFDEIDSDGYGDDTAKRAGTERGSPDQAYPKHKAIGIIDWNYDDVRSNPHGPLHQGCRRIAEWQPPEQPVLH